MNASSKIPRPEIEITKTVAIDRAKVAREKGNAALREARALARYRGADNERTKPSVMLLDWVGDDEVTVRWETVRREAQAAPGPAAFDAPPLRFGGISGRTGGVMLGVVLGIAVTIGLLALLGAGSTAAASAPDAVAVPQWVDQVPAAAVVRAPLVTPVATVPAAVLVPQRPRRPRTMLNVDSSLRSNAIVDGRPVGTTPQRFAVSPGEHTVVFVHPTQGRRTLSVDAMKDRVTFATAKF